jgi:Domain of unknown function (DUF4926)
MKEGNINHTLHPQKVAMKPELFDVVELLVNLPEHKQSIAPRPARQVPECIRAKLSQVAPLAIGTQGTIIECHDPNHFEVEFSNENGETITLCVLSPQQFMVVWQARTKQWLTTTDKITSIFSNLPENKQEQILDFARFLYQKA